MPGQMDAPNPPQQPSRFETEVRRVRALIDREQFGEALVAAQALLPEAPENRDLLYLTAVAQRFLRRVPDALKTLARLEQLYPEYPRTFQERGHGYVAQREVRKAIAAFERAVLLNSSLVGSWRGLHALYTVNGEPAKAENAKRELEKLAALPQAVVTAFSLYSDGELEDAERLVRQYLLQNGDHVEAMRLLAQIGTRHDVLDDAEVLLAKVLQMAPHHDLARYEYAIVLLRRHKHAEAATQMEALLAREPKNRLYLTTYATVCAGLGRIEEALPRYRELLKEVPDDPELHLSIGHLLKTLGDSDAIAAYRAAATARPDYGEAYWSLADMKTYRFTDEELARMRAQEAAPQRKLEDRYQLCFAIGKALEDRGAYEEAFTYYARGNELKKTECRYRPGITERNTAAQKAVCTREFFAARAGYGAESDAPIFIVGLPRSGSTLIEQILASHTQVEGTMELADIARMVQALQGRDVEGAESRYPGVLAEFSAEDCRSLGERYLEDTRIYRGGKPRFIDKMPNNFRHLGLIHLILPNARIIDARREAMACCFSNFKQLFASGQQFTYSIEDIARYYRSYVELMAHWQEVLPGRILCVQHEELIADVEGGVRRILEFCGLPFEPACVEFHRTERRIHTASAAQVRQPVNREGVDQWKHFEPWLGPLKSALGDLAAP
jgi:tetratricopeptide (TPR) repeat protein